MDANPTLDLGDIQIKGSVTNIHFKNLTCFNRNHVLVAYAKFSLMTDLSVQELEKNLLKVENN